MSMKKILMAAAAVTALTAGVANAATINANNTADVSGVIQSTKIGGKFIGSGTGSSAVSDPYTLANEVKLTSSSIFGSTASSGNVNNLKLIVDASSTTAIGVGEYLVTFNITNGSFDTASLTSGALTVTGTSLTVSTTTSSVSAGTVSFIVKATAGNLDKLFLNVGVKTGTTRGTMSVSGSIVTLSGAVNVDGGSFGSVNLVDYRDGMSFSATAASPTLSLASGFKKFQGASSSAADVTEATIAEKVKFAANNGTVTTDLVYDDFAGGELVPSDIATATLTIGGDLSAFNAKLGITSAATQGADAVATAPGFITANETNRGVAGASTPGAKTLTGADGAFITLSQKATAVVGTESTYTVTPAITYTSSTLTPLTYAAKTIGSVKFEGTSFYAAWVGDGTNGITYSIRLGNRTSTAISSVKATLLNPVTTGTSGTVASTAACEVGPIPASGELIITSGSLTTCFGAFKRSDVRFIIQASPESMTAKMRTVSAGMVTEAPLGGGSDAAKAN